MSSEKITMPKLGESVTEGTISKWLVSVGDTVKKYEPLAEVMTDKVNAEIPSSFTGSVKELIAGEGDTLQVGEVICILDVEGEEEVTVVTASKQNAESSSKEEKSVSNKARYSPAVLRLSQEAGLDLSQIKGTGMGGRITRKDVQAAISGGQKPQQDLQVPTTKAPVVQKEPQTEPVVTQAPTQQMEPVVQIQASPGDVEIPVTGIRKAIAANMKKSKHDIPHAWTMIEVDATKLVNYRNEVKDSFKKDEGYNLTYFAFFVKAVAQTLKEFPEINSTWAGDKIIRKKDINISIAVATEAALYVPVIKNADEKSVKGIAREITELAAKARKGTLQLHEMEGGTFTVNNTGSFGSVQSMGIINHPQAAILQVESIVKRPVIKDGMIAISDMVNLCMSLDHRVLDGLVCGRFMQRLKERIENTTKESTPIY
ncbi:dihydrolipoamide acetyltransferase family protein [Bacillales bacterium AN1005]|uniref:dihydrolipoamide acetyltransferase family protein n=1 Tax=Niallia taxi TaxID=2499688 RepID=UPI0021A34848|nr:dihydrolipoamide acetyltransferase family protein [Niallia taxi]MCT2346246.1 2-oxo acid dehydrogenase subunit E2 [Niallia taxi]MED3961947.1 dihydrolipoamide acetyltransferase family protein [Niallia taxi]